MPLCIATGSLRCCDLACGGPALGESGREVNQQSSFGKCWCLASRRPKSVFALMGRKENQKLPETRREAPSRALSGSTRGCSFASTILLQSDASCGASLASQNRIAYRHVG